QGAVGLTAGTPVPVEIDYSSISGLFSQEIHFGWQTPQRSGIPAAAAAARHADAAVVFANDAQGEGMDRASLSLPGDQDRLAPAGRGPTPPPDRGPDRGRPGADPWPPPGGRLAGGWVPGAAIRPRGRRRAVRRCQPGRPPAGGLPGQRHPRTRTHHTAPPLPGGPRRRALRGGTRCRLPVVRRHRAAAAVPLRLRPVLPAFRRLSRPRVLPP